MKRSQKDQHHHHHCGCQGSCGCGHDHHDHHDHHCGCGHDHHDHHCGCGHDHGSGEGGGVWSLAIGGGLFLVGLFLSWLLPGTVFPVAAYLLGWLVLGWEVLASAGRGLIRGRVLDENFLMGLATIGAFLIGEYPEAVGVMLFFRLGEWFEHMAVERSRKEIMAAVDLRPETVELEDGRILPAAQAEVGMRLRVRPGDRIPLDGRVVAGKSRVDTSPITGESVPVAVEAGSQVLSGCVNGPGQLTIVAEKPLETSMVTRILESVEHAAAGKPRMDRFITRVARVYTPIVVGLAVLTAVVPSLITGQWRYWVYTALSFLVMSCPCALVLSVPLAFFSGIGAGSRQGILFKDGAAIEALARVRAVAMDKTGTLTEGDFSLQEVEGEVLRLCAACETGSNHPVAVSIVSFAREQGLSLPVPEEVEELPGMGIRARVEGKGVLCGNEALMAQAGISVPSLPEAPGTRVLVAVEGAFAGWLRIADTVKADSPQAVAELKALSVFPAMLTGDRETAARLVADRLGIPAVFSRLLPEEKLQVLRRLRQEQGPVMFVGDGINDAPVLAGADVGAAMGSGADAALEAADVVFMTSRPRAIPQAVRIARRTQAIAWQNVVFALAIKGAVMLLGLAGRASMWAAVFADSGVALLCVLNAIRLLYRKNVKES